MPRSNRYEHLAGRARQIVESLGGTWRGDRGMCCCPAHEDCSPSLGVRLGRKAILFHCFAGCPNADVIAGLAGRGVRARDLSAGPGEALPCPDARDSGANARRLWQEAGALRESPAEAYLASRAITQVSRHLRFHPRTPLGPRGAVRFLPAMLAAVSSDAGVIAIHRTFLDPAGHGLARFDQPRRALGRPGTGAVRLAPDRDGLLGLAEGIETALSAMQLFAIPCWATLGNERFALIAIPQGVRELHLFIDHDAGGALAECRARQAHKLADRRIVTRRPDLPGDDWNDVLRRQSESRLTPR